MEQREVTAQVPANEEKGQKQLGPCTVMVNYAETLDEAKKMYGEEAMLSNAFANWRVTLQANIRNGLKAGKSQEQLQTDLADAKMGVAATGSKVDPQQAFLMQFKNATPERQAEMLEMLRSAAEPDEE